MVNLPFCMRKFFRKLALRISSPECIRISATDRILFSKRLALYLRAGVPILEAIDLIRTSAGSNSHAHLLRILMQDIQRGVSVSVSLARFRKAYSSTYIQIISIGERSGTLPASLASLTAALEERRARTRAILGALAYPLLLVMGSIAISLFLLVYAFPKIVPLFIGLHAKLPFTTRTLLALSSFFQKHWLAAAFCTGVSYICIHLAARLPITRHYLHRAVIRLPVVGALVRTSILASVFRTITTLLPSGVRLDEALLIARDGISNAPYRISLDRIRRGILRGNTMSAMLGHEKSLFPGVALQLMAVGEMTGTLSMSAGSIAHIFEEDLAERLKAFSALLEPLIMVAMGFVIGFIAMAIISPMYGITQNLSA